MQILLRAICAAGLNRAMIRDALYGTQTYTGVTGAMQFDPNDKQMREMYLGTVQNGHIVYRKVSMQKEYARVGEDGVQYAGPPVADTPGDIVKVAVFGPAADKLVQSATIIGADGRKWELVPVSSDVPWGKASNELVRAVYDQNVIAMIALDRASSHLAEQIGVKAFVPVIAVSSDRALTSTNIPWIFRLPEGTSLQQVLQTLAAAERLSGPNRAKLRAVLASGKQVAGVQFYSTGEAQ
jgi:ABC-type branched-subunit amino acid transport system substrate-binding protein